MGYYYNPPEEIERLGRKLKGITYDELVAQLKSDEVLFSASGQPVAIPASDGSLQRGSSAR